MRSREDLVKIGRRYAATNKHLQQELDAYRNAFGPLPDSHSNPIAVD